MAKAANEAVAFLKELGNPKRILMLCILSQGERSVSEFEHLLGLPQGNASQHLARMRYSGLVESRRKGKAMYYNITSSKVQIIIGALHEAFLGK
jgi:DNA-binding transcriptional ArsR family regulator